MSERIQELIDKYENEIRGIEKHLKESYPSKNMELRLIITIEKYKEFVEDLETMRGIINCK